MTITCVRPTAARAAVAVVLAGLVSGAVAPTLAAAGPWAAPAGIGAALALAAWLARGGHGPLLPRLAVASGGGALAGLLLAGPAGLAHAAFGLALGLALQRPERRGQGFARQVADALPVAAGALLGGVLAGAIAPLLGAVTPAASAALLVGAVSVGVALGDLTRDVVLVRDTAPAWIVTLLRACEVDDPRGHAVLTAAAGAHRGAIQALGEARLDADAARESALLARDLLLATGRAVEEARRMLHAGAGLDGPATPPVEHAELAAAAARIGATLQGRRDASLEDASRHAAAIGRLAATLVGRGAAADRDVDALTLERRAEALNRRVDLGGAA